MSNDPDIEELTILDDKKTILLTICSNFLTSKLNELFVENSFSNTDLLLLLDDIMSSLYQMILNQIKQMNADLSDFPRARSCLSMIISDLKFSWDKGLEKIANKIVRSQMNEKTIFQMFNQIDKFEKSEVNTIFYKLKKCIEK